MRNPFHVFQPPGGIIPWIGGKRIGVHCLWLWLFMLLVGTDAVEAQDMRDWLPKQGQSADHTEILEWQMVKHVQHPGLSKWCIALGDINADGFDDFAMGSGYDTTFIFLGGVPFDHDPAFFLSGGSSGIAFGDLNGDGRRDLITGVDLENRELDPEKRGRISVYFGRETAPYLGPEPDLVIRGDSSQYWGSHSFPEGGGRRSGMQILDFNGDGYDDLLTQTLTGRLPVMYQPIIFYGGPGLDTIPDVEIPGVERGSSNRYPMDILIGDLNGDGCDDILLQGSAIDSGIRVYYWDLFLGNREGKAERPYRTLRSDIGWSPLQSGQSAVYDTNNDGIDDIVDAGTHRRYGDPLVFLGSYELPENIEPNDSIPNPWTTEGGILGARRICPVGDMNGDGTRDLLIGWATYFIPDGTLYYLYPMQPAGLIREHTGHIGMIPNEDYVVVGAYDVGDVNGDGFDDFAVCGRGLSWPPTIGWQSTRRFIICLGASNLRTDVPPLASPSALSMELFPNPVLGGAGTVTLRPHGIVPGTVMLEVIDALGRVVISRDDEVLSTPSELTLSVSGLHPGSYVVYLCQGNTMAQSMLTIF